MNAEQASKDLFARADPAVFRGRPSSCGEEARSAPTDLAGVVASACMYTKIDRNTGNPDGGGGVIHQPAPREGQAGPFGVAERPVLPVKPGNAGGGKGPWFKVNVKGARAGRLV